MKTRTALLGMLLLTACGGTSLEPSIAPLTAAPSGEAANGVTGNRDSQRVAPLLPTVVDSKLPDTDVERYAASIDNAPMKGATSPTVYIVQYTDFECPFCARVLPTLERLLEKYPNDVALVFRHNPLPFHKNAKNASYAAIEARQQLGDAGFWKMHDVMFKNPRKLGIESLKRYGQEVGLDPVALQAAMADGRHEPVVTADAASAQKLGSRGTPGHFINGRQVMGAQPFDRFDDIVKEEIALANKEMAEGHLRASLYVRRMEGALTEAIVKPSKARQAPAPDLAVYRVPVSDSPTLGNANALVTLVAFTDVQCPFCARSEATLKALQTKYGDELRIVFKHNPLPFHKGAMPAHKLLLEAKAQKGNKGFFKLKDKLFEQVQLWGARTPQETAEEYEEGIKKRLVELAKSSGLNARRAKRAFSKTSYAERISADQQLARRVGARGTPAFFINGRKLSGAQPAAEFETLIDEQLAKAKKLVAAGTSAKKVYETMIADGVRNVDAAKPGPEVTIPSDAPSRGPANAKITIQIFSDFQCPFCGRVLPTLDKIEKEYKNKVRFVWHHLPLPFHQNAKLAAEASVEVHLQGGDAAFWKFHDTLFANQNALSQSDLESYASKLRGIDATRFSAALTQRTHSDRVEDDLKAAKDAGISGTPNFILSRNGRRLTVAGAQPYEKFKEAIDELTP